MGRPPISPHRILLPVSDDWVAAVDRWRAKQPGLPNRSEAIRRLTALGLKVKGVEKSPKRDKGRA